MNLWAHPEIHENPHNLSWERRRSQDVKFFGLSSLPTSAFHRYNGIQGFCSIDTKRKGYA